MKAPFTLMFLATSVLASCAELSAPVPDASVLERVVAIYYDDASVKESSAEATPAEPPHLQRLSRWLATYQHLNSRYEDLAASYTGDDPFVERTLTQLRRLTAWAVSDIEAAFASPPEPGSTDFETLVTRFESLNVAIGDRISVVEAKLGRTPQPK